MERAKNWKKNAEGNLKDANDNLDLILKSKDTLDKKWGERKMVDDQEGLKKCQVKKKAKKRSKTPQSEELKPSKRSKNSKKNFEWRG
jgi:hypothetical protein